MASLRKRGKVWYFRFVDADGVKREAKGCTDRRATEELARDAESMAAKVKAGLVDPRDLARLEHATRPIGEHLAAWRENAIHRGHTIKQADQSAARVRRLVAIVFGANPDDIDGKTMTRQRLEEARLLIGRLTAKAKLADLSPAKVQAALARLRDSGRSNQTACHYRAAARTFSKWCHDTGRTQEDVLRGVTGYNVAEDPRHDRRSIGLDELQRLIRVAHEGPDHLGMTGPERALTYRLAVATGLRFAEIQSVTPKSFDFNAEPPTVAVAPAYTKNGESATLALSIDLADDLRPYVANLAAGEPVFKLPDGKGAKLLRFDLKRAGIAYADSSGRFFDYHALRGMTATLADVAGISPRTVQAMMRHSTLELTGRYTRPRVVDLNRAAELLPSLRPDSGRPHASILAKTGTDVQSIKNSRAHYLPTTEDGLGRNLSHSDVLTGLNEQPSMKVSPHEIQDMTASVGSGRLKMEMHPIGFEPITFGSVDRCSVSARSTTAKGLRLSPKTLAHHLPTDTRKTDADLADLVDAWPDLPEAIKAGILAMVKAARNQ